MYSFYTRAHMWYLMHLLDKMQPRRRVIVVAQKQETTNVIEPSRETPGITEDILRCRFDASVSWMSALCEAFSSAKSVEFDCWQHKFANLRRFLLENFDKMQNTFYFFDENLVHTDVVPFVLWRKLTIVEKLRLSSGVFGDGERYNFRLLVFVLFNHALNVEDCFVICNRRNILALVEKIVHLRLAFDKIEVIARVLEEDYVDLRLKCRTFWKLWKSSRGDTTKTDFV